MTNTEAEPTSSSAEQAEELKLRNIIVEASVTLLRKHFDGTTGLNQDQRNLAAQVVSSETLKTALNGKLNDLSTLELKKLERSLLAFQSFTGLSGRERTLQMVRIVAKQVTNFFSFLRLNDIQDAFEDAKYKVRKAVEGKTTNQLDLANLGQEIGKSLIDFAKKL